MTQLSELTNLREQEAMLAQLTAAVEQLDQALEEEIRAQPQLKIQVEQGLNLKRRQKVRLQHSKEEEFHLDLISSLVHLQHRHNPLGLDAEAAARPRRRKRR